MQEKKAAGLTSTAGYQVGVRRTFPISTEKAWELLTSDTGVKIWLGDTALPDIQKGQEYRTEAGISGEVRVVNPFVNLRLTWKRSNWTQPSTLQIRTISNGHDRTTISFHQENLHDSSVREEMKLHWEEVLNRLKTLI